VPRHLKYFSKKDSKLGAVDYGIALGSFFFWKIPIIGVFFFIVVYVNIFHEKYKKDNHINV
jgi:hypothetical protein